MNHMQLKDRYRDEAWAMEQFEKSEYASISVNGENGIPYTIPICVVRIDDALYFHTALQGTAMNLIRKDGHVCVSCVTYTKRDPMHTTLLFRSAVAFGMVTEVMDTKDKQRIMIGFFSKYLPGNEKAQAYALRASAVASVWRIDINEISGKENKAQP